jgi:O-antigen/teichoic acid export membrane protein
MSRAILGDTIKYLPAKIIPGVVGLLSVPIYTHFLSPNQYGQYALTMSAVSMIAALCFSGINSSVVRFNIIHGVNALHAYLQPRLILAITIAGVLWTVVAAVLRFPLQQTTFLVAGYLWIAVQGHYEYLLSWLRSRGFAAMFSVAISWRSVAALMFGVVLARIDNLTGANLIIVPAVAMAVGVPVFRRKALAISEHTGIATRPLNSREITRYGLPAAFISLITICLSNADRFLINRMIGVEAVAIYSASYDISEKTVFFANSMFLLSSSVLGFKEFERHGELAAVNFLESLMRFYLLVAPPFVLYLTTCAGRIIAFFLPEGYATGTTIIGIIATSGLLVGIMHRYSILLSFHKRTDLIFRGSAVALLVNLIACVFLIPSFGITGAAVGTTFAYASWLLSIRLAAAAYRTPRFPWRTSVRVTIALAVQWTVLRYVSTYISDVGMVGLALLLVLGLVAYGLSLILVREISLSEVKEIWQTKPQTSVHSPR